MNGETRGKYWMEHENLLQKPIYIFTDVVKTVHKKEKGTDLPKWLCADPSSRCK